MLFDSTSCKFYIKSIQQIAEFLLKWAGADINIQLQKLINLLMMIIPAKFQCTLNVHF